VFQSPKGSGKWYAQVTRPDGEVTKRRVPSEKAGWQKVRELLAELESGINYAAGDPTVSEWMRIWLEKYCKRLKPNIKADYAGVVTRYIDGDPIGRRKVRALKPAEVQDWIDRLAEKVAAQTVRNAYARLRTALKVAVTRHYATRNVAEGADLPEVRPPPICPLDLGQALTLLAAVAGHRWALLYRLALNLGLRQAELLGLTWAAFDLEKGTVRIFRQLRRVPGEDGKKIFALQPTKTAGSDRLLRLDADLIAEIRAFRVLWLEERLISGGGRRNPWELLFVSETGAPIHVSNLTSHFKKTLTAAGLPTIRFHDLRHTAATLMLDDNVPMVAVSEILGHSSVAVTAKIYAHAVDKSKETAIARLSERLGGG
jgi:integrase